MFKLILAVSVMIGLSYFIYDMRSQPKIEFLEKEDKNFPYVDLSVYFDGLRDLQSAVTALHNIHEERLE